MNSFPILSLQKKRIVVTRAQQQAAELTDLLRDRGAEALQIPLVECRALLNPPDAQTSLDALANFDWIIFTSSNAIRFFFDLNGDAKIPTTVRIACVGRKTAETLGAYCNRPSFVPDHFSGTSLAMEMDVKPGQSVLFPSATQASVEPARLLESRGVIVKRWPIYSTLARKIDLPGLRILNSGFDAITFASPSAVNSFCDQIPNSQQILGAPFVACIGQTTRLQAIERGLSVGETPEHSDSAGLVNILDRHFSSGVFHG